jgi:hypothetical protein
MYVETSNAVDRAFAAVRLPGPIDFPTIYKDAFAIRSVTAI